MELGPGQVWVVSCDMERFKTERRVIAQHFGLLKKMMDDFPDATELPIQNVTGPVLAKVFSCLKKPANEEAEAVWDVKSLEVDKSMLLELLSAADYLDAKGLLDLTCMHITNMFKGKAPQQIWDPIGIVNDLTEEEEAALRFENAWGFE